MGDTARLALTVSPEDKAKIVLAAQLERRSTSNFLEWAALARADEVLRTHGAQGQAEPDTHAPKEEAPQVQTSKPVREAPLQKVVEKVRKPLAVEADPTRPTDPREDMFKHTDGKWHYGDEEADRSYTWNGKKWMLDPDPDADPDDPWGTSPF